MLELSKLIYPELLANHSYWSYCMFTNLANDRQVQAEPSAPAPWAWGSGCLWNLVDTNLLYIVIFNIISIQPSYCGGFVNSFGPYVTLETSPSGSPSVPEAASLGGRGQLGSIALFLALRFSSFPPPPPPHHHRHRFLLQHDFPIKTQILKRRPLVSPKLFKVYSI